MQDIVDVLFDFSKTLDVNHSLLIDKLWLLGVHGPLLSWISVFLLVALCKSQSLDVPAPPKMSSVVCSRAQSWAPSYF